MAHTDTSHALIAYLERCGGSDRHEFLTDENHPDIAAARVFAETMRKKLGEALDSVVTVEQRVHVVRVALVAEAAVVA